MLKWSLFLIFGSALTLCACAPSGTSFRDAPDPLTSEEERIQRVGKVWGDDAFEFGGGSSRGQNGDDPNLFPVNKYLWRATLQALSHLPLRQADAQSGLILTEWYQDPENPSEKIKVDVRLSGKDLKSDGISLSVFRQKRAQSREWLDHGNSPDVAEKLVKVILRSARQLKFLS